MFTLGNNFHVLSLYKVIELLLNDCNRRRLCCEKRNAVLVIVDKGCDMFNLEFVLYCVLIVYEPAGSFTMRDVVMEGDG